MSNTPYADKAQPELRKALEDLGTLAAECMSFVDTSANVVREMHGVFMHYSPDGEQQERNAFFDSVTEINTNRTAVKKAGEEILACVRDAKETPRSQDADIKAAADITLRGLLLRAVRAAKTMSDAVAGVRDHLKRTTAATARVVKE